MLLEIYAAGNLNRLRTALGATRSVAISPAANAPTPAGGNPAERSRVRQILTNGAADGREPLARQLAFNTDMSAQAAIATLEAAPLAGSTMTPDPAASHVRALDEAVEREVAKVNSSLESEEASGRHSLQIELAAEADDDPQLRLLKSVARQSAIAAGRRRRRRTGRPPVNRPKRRDPLRDPNK
jgi:hypothetical protein